MNEVNRKYFDVIIENDKFHIVESSTKPQKRGSTLSVLSRIEEVLKKNLQYSDLYQDSYSQLSKKDLLKIFQNKSNEISQRYETKYKKHKKYNWILKKIFGKTPLSIVKATNTRIRNLTAGRLFPSLPNELIQEVAKHIGISEFTTFAQLSGRGQAHADRAFIQRARDFGYKGIDNKSEAVKYLQDLFNEVDHLFVDNIIPVKYFSFKKTKKVNYLYSEVNTPHGRLDAEKALQTLRSLPIEELFGILSNPNLYSPKFAKIRKIFQVENSQVVSKSCSPADKQKGNEALLLAAQNGEANLVELLLWHGADIETKDKDGLTPLGVAVLKQQKEIVDFLIKRGAKIDTLSIRGTTPLISATRTGSLELVQLLLKAGASKSINHINNYHNHALHYAVAAERIDIIELLLSYGADINLKNQKGYTPLELAVNNQLVATVDFLIKKGAKIDTIGNTIDNLDNTLLIIAINDKDASLEMIERLLEAGAAKVINHQNKSSNSALHYAVKNKRIDIVELLLSHGIDLNLRNLDNETPLSLAQHWDYKDIAELLSINGGKT